MVSESGFVKMASFAVEVEAEMPYPLAPPQGWEAFVIFENQKLTIGNWQLAKPLTQQLAIGNWQLAKPYANPHRTASKLRQIGIVWDDTD